MSCLRIFICTVMLSLPGLVCAGNVVTVVINDSVHGFSEPVSLAKLLQKLDEPATVYWPAAALFQFDPVVEQQKYDLMQALIRRLSQLPQGSAAKAELAGFITVLSGIKVARRLALDVDYERARLVPRFNPLLAEGRFFLSAKPALSGIVLLGAVNRHHAVLTATEVVSTTGLYKQFASTTADNSSLFWSVNGTQWQPAGIAYWNNTPLDLAAGAMVYVPFSASVLGDNSDLLNQQVIAVLRHWVR